MTLDKIRPCLVLVRWSSVARLQHARLQQYWLLYGAACQLELMPIAGLLQSCCNALATRRRPRCHTSMVATFATMLITATLSVLAQQQVSNVPVLLLPHICLLLWCLFILPCCLARRFSSIRCDVPCNTDVVLCLPALVLRRVGLACRRFVLICSSNWRPFAIHRGGCLLLQHVAVLERLFGNLHRCLYPALPGAVSREAKRDF